MTPRYLQVRKCDLPLVVVVEGDGGQKRVLELAPAAPGKLSAYIREPAPEVASMVLRAVREVSNYSSR